MLQMGEILTPFPRLAVPDVYGDYSTSRLLVMEDVQGGPIADAPQGTARSEAAKQLLESFYKQILVDGFFHADPHPGNLMWQPSSERVFFLDLGMIGEVGPDMREHMMLLLMAFWQQDVGFLTDVTLMLAGAIDRSDLDTDAFSAEIGALMARYHGASLKDIQLGPVLQEMTEIALRHNVPLPASLTLTGKALAQMQLAAAQLDPELDPFDIAGRFLMRSVITGMGAKLDPKSLFYQSQRLKVRFLRVVEAVERLIGARPGQARGQLPGHEPGGHDPPGRAPARPRPDRGGRGARRAASPRCRHGSSPGCRCRSVSSAGSSPSGCSTTS